MTRTDHEKKIIRRIVDRLHKTATLAQVLRIAGMLRVKVEED